MDLTEEYLRLHRNRVLYVMLKNLYLKLDEPFKGIVPDYNYLLVGYQINYLHQSYIPYYGLVVSN